MKISENQKRNKQIYIVPFIILAMFGFQKNGWGQHSTDQSSPLSRIATAIDLPALSDQFKFSQAIGMKMENGQVITSPFSFERCGTASPPEQPTTVRQFIYHGTPWFLDSSKNGKLPCSANYVEKLSADNRIEAVSAKLSIDAQKICITSSDISQNFPGSTKSSEYGPSGFAFRYIGKGGIGVLFLSSLNRATSKCTETILLQQYY